MVNNRILENYKVVINVILDNWIQELSVYEKDGKPVIKIYNVYLKSGSSVLAQQQRMVQMQKFKAKVNNTLYAMARKP